jgi:hypothetical protein
MGDIGESAVLRYLIINEIRKVPAFKPNRELEKEEKLFKACNQWGRSQELKEKLADFTVEKLEEFEKKELDRIVVPRRIVPELLGEKTRAFLDGLEEEKKDNK